MADEVAPAPLVVERHGGVALMRLDRPEKRNAIDEAMRRAMRVELERLSAAEEVRVVVLTGNGPGFCAGADLLESATRPVDPSLSAAVTASLDAFDKPVLAAVNGVAYGGGFELALACDLRVAGRSARFCLPEVAIGSLPGSGGTQRLARAVPSAVAARLLYTGEAIDAAEALRVGLVSDVFDDDDLERGALGIAERIASKAPLSLRALKQALAAANPLPGLELERALWASLATTEDREEGRRAFRERRPPEFKGR